MRITPPCDLTARDRDFVHAIYAAVSPRRNMAVVDSFVLLQSELCSRAHWPVPSSDATAVSEGLPACCVSASLRQRRPPPGAALRNYGGGMWPGGGHPAPAAPS